MSKEIKIEKEKAIKKALLKEELIAFQESVGFQLKKMRKKKEEVEQKLAE